MLRRNGWKGHGPVPWEHGPNRGFLRSLAALTGAARIGEDTRVTAATASCATPAPGHAALPEEFRGHRANLGVTESPGVRPTRMPLRVRCVTHRDLMRGQ